MQVELNIPDHLERKLRALYTLIDSEDTLDDIVIALMDEIVSARITELVEFSPSKATPKPETDYHPAPFRIPTKRFNEKSPRDYDQFLEDGLGDEISSEGDIDEEVPQPVTDMYDLIPKNKGRSETLKELDTEMDVEDPEHEAKASATVVPYAGPAQNVFAEMMGMPSLLEEEPAEVDPRIAKRKKRLNIKGKVSPATEVTESF